MSYAAIASHNVAPGDHGVKPDQGLVEGHFAGEHAAHADIDHKLNILPAGEDPSHPHIRPTIPQHPEPVVVHPAEVVEPHVSSVAPEPAKPPAHVKLPESGEKYEKKAEKAAKKDEKKVDKSVEKVEKDAVKAKEEIKDTSKKVEKDVKEVSQKVEKDVKEVSEKASEDVKESSKKLAGDVKEVSSKVAEGAKDVGATVAAGAKDVSSKVAEGTRDVSQKVADGAKDFSKKAEKDIKEFGEKAQEKGKEYKEKAKVELSEAGNNLGPYWERTKDVVLRPGTLGGLMGVVNVGLLSTLGYFAYTRRDQPWDRRLIGGAVAGTLALFSAEGFVTESYLQTPEGRQEAERAKREGSRAYMQAREVTLRPGVFGGLAGAINIAIIGTVGYFSYRNWNRPWDQRVVSAVTVGLVTLSGLEGYAGKAYADNELPKRR